MWGATPCIPRIGQALQIKFGDFLDFTTTVVNSGNLIKEELIAICVRLFTPFLALSHAL
jgi:hypothetical protein